MNKSKFLSIIFIACFNIFQLLAGENMFTLNNKDVNHGNKIYGKEIVNEIETNGSVKLQGTKVTNHLQVNGLLEAADAQIEEMQINGRAVLNNCSIKQKSIICGSLVATTSKFADELSVSSEKNVFNSCILSSLRILKVERFQGAQIIKLNGKTKINGPITFENGNGEVILDPGSEITGGVIGGKIIK